MGVTRLKNMQLGPSEGQVTVRTGVSGSAARMGHRLVLEVGSWSAKVILDQELPVSVLFRAELGSLRVLSGKGGVTPLTVVDKQVIRRNAVKTMDVEEYPEVVFSSTRITPNETGFDCNGDLTIHGRTLPLSAALHFADGRIAASVPVVQSDFGIRPYSAMLGQLKVDDEVVVDLDVGIPS